MTSLAEPDYNIKLSIESDNYDKITNISGTLFVVKIVRSHYRNPVGGILSIPLQDSLSPNSEIEADLWVDSARAIIPLQEELRFHLIDECDPLNYGSGYGSELCKILPLELSGIVLSKYS